MNSDNELHMLSTIDNPYNPFTQWDEWLVYDTRSQYWTPAFLARVARISQELSDADYNIAIENAIDEIVKENVLGMYIKVTKDFVPRDGGGGQKI